MASLILASSTIMMMIIMLSFKFFFYSLFFYILRLPMMILVVRIRPEGGVLQPFCLLWVCHWWFLQTNTSMSKIRVRVYLYIGVASFFSFYSHYQIVWWCVLLSMLRMEKGLMSYHPLSFEDTQTRLKKREREIEREIYKHVFIFCGDIIFIKHI